MIDDELLLDVVEAATYPSTGACYWKTRQY